MNLIKSSHQIQWGTKQAILLLRSIGYVPCRRCGAKYTSICSLLLLLKPLWGPHPQNQFCGYGSQWEEQRPPARLWGQWVSTSQTFRASCVLRGWWSNHQQTSGSSAYHEIGYNSIRLWVKDCPKKKAPTYLRRVGPCGKEPEGGLINRFAQIINFVCSVGKGETNLWNDVVWSIL